MIGYLDPDIVNQCFGEYPNPLFKMDDNFIKEPYKNLKMSRKLTGTFYLALKQSKYAGLTARLTTKQPQLCSDERAIKVRLEIPESLFKTPQLEFNVSVPENSVTPQILPVEVQDNIKSIIEQQTGCVVKLNVVDKLNPDDEQS